MSYQQELKNKARKYYQGLDISTGSEGFPEASSFIYGFMEGYELAQKEIQDKLDAAIEVIKKLADHCFEEPDTYFACVFCDMGDSGHSLKGKGYHDDYCLAKRARDFLKARNE